MGLPAWESTTNFFKAGLFYAAALKVVRLQMEMVEERCRCGMCGQGLSCSELQQYSKSSLKKRFTIILHKRDEALSKSRELGQKKPRFSAEKHQSVAREAVRKYIYQAKSQILVSKRCPVCSQDVKEMGRLLASLDRNAMLSPFIKFH